MSDDTARAVPTRSGEEPTIEAATLVLRRFACCPLGAQHLMDTLVRPFATGLIDDAMIERAAREIALKFGLGYEESDGYGPDYWNHIAACTLRAALKQIRQPEPPTRTTHANPPCGCRPIMGGQCALHAALEQAESDRDDLRLFLRHALELIKNPPPQGVVGTPWWAGAVEIAEGQS